MQDNTPLDAPTSTPDPKRSSLAHRIAFRLELLLWAFVLIALFLKMESWEGGSEILILSTSVLILAYLLVPTLILGSRGWGRHIGSHAVGFVMTLAVAASLFRIESWEGAREMAILPFIPCLLLLITVGVLLSIKPDRWHDGPFYKQVVVRLLIVALLSFGGTASVFFH